MKNNPSFHASKRAGIYVLIGILMVAVIGVAFWRRDTITAMLGWAGNSQNGMSAAKDTAPKQLWTCSMHPQVIRDKPGSCPICHMQLTPVRVQESATTGQLATATEGISASGPVAPGERKIKYWWDPMLSPPYISDKPGKSPMGMELVPVYEDQLKEGRAAIAIDPTIVQNMGVRVAAVTEGQLNKNIRLVGYLDEAQPNVHDINLRVSGWIRRLHANTEGQHVEAGDPLFDLYSPELQVAVEELIGARRTRGSINDTERQMGGELYDAAVSKLELFGLERGQIAALAKLEAAPATVTFVSPLSGDITEKPIVEGAAVKSGDRVLRIVDHSTLWLDAKVFEKDLPFVKIGQKASATIASRSGESLAGEIVFIHPRVDETTRTGTARMAISNTSLTLKPGMYAIVNLRVPLSERAVMVPREAIIDQGDAQLAFVAKGGGKFEPRSVQMGPMGEGGMVQVSRGLSPGEEVATSGQFLLDSESRLREAIQKYLNQSTRGAVMLAPQTKQDQVSQAATTSHAGGPMTDDQVARIDAVTSEYLKLSESLGAMQTATSPVDTGRLMAAAKALNDSQKGAPGIAAASDLVGLVEATHGQSIDEQREALKRISESVIALADTVSAQGTDTKKLYVMHCPMANANWLQTTDKVANPYFADEMKECGSLERVIKMRGSVTP